MNSYLGWYLNSHGSSIKMKKKEESKDSSFFCL